MEIELGKELVTVSETVYDAAVEQGIEYDYVLPEYYPDIFKVLKCAIKPGIASYRISGGQLILDGTAYIKALYAAEDGELRCVEHKYTYSKNVDIIRGADVPDGADVAITLKTDYANCRGVSGRRLNINGAVSAKIKVTVQKQSEILVSVNGAGLETKRTPIKFSGERLKGSTQTVIREEIETGSGKDGDVSVISVSESTDITDVKIVGEKVIIKGTATVKALYVTVNESKGVTESLEAELPINVIVDVPNITPEHTVYASVTVLDSDLKARPSDVAATRVFGYDITLDIKVSAHTEKTVDAVTDVYSTEFELTAATKRANAETVPQIVKEQFTLKNTVSVSGGASDNISEIIDADCVITNTGITVNGAELRFTGQAIYSVLGRAEDGTAIYAEKTEVFDVPVQITETAENYIFDPEIEVKSVSASIADAAGTTADFRVTLTLGGALYRIITTDVIGEIGIDTDAPKNKQTDYGLKVYYASEGDTLWEIGKRESVSAGKIAD
ncbi:MAG: DUF3794 domain-containing protein, partial [Oscillospiraceae bacterium]|nr:DUF3794 domain-containing protein [Oscillospiraceae bacterium]